MQDAVAIALDNELPYTGLRGFDVDPRLWHYVPRTLAAAEGVLPIALVGDELKLASSRPDPDLSSLETHFPYLRLGLVIAPEAEIDAVLARDPQGPDA